jgi:hypothetical protein
MSTRNSGFDARGSKWEFAEAGARRTGNGVGDGGCRRSLCRLSGTKEGLTRLVNQVHLDCIGQIGEAEDRVGAPIPAPDARRIKGNCLAQRPTCRLHDAAFDLVAHAIGIDDLTTVIGRHAASQPYASSFALHLQFDGHRRIGCQVLVLGEGEAASNPFCGFTAASQPNFSAASWTTARARASCRWRRRNSIGSAPAACASSSMKLSSEKTFM